MGKIAVVTDSNSGITQKQAEELGIRVLPMPFFINEKMYFEITEDGQVVKSVMKDEIIEVPNTDKNETKELIVGGVILILLGAGAVIYANKKRKK